MVRSFDLDEAKSMEDSRSTRRASLFPRCPVSVLGDSGEKVVALMDAPVEVSVASRRPSLR